MTISSNNSQLYFHTSQRNLAWGDPRFSAHGGKDFIWKRLCNIAGIRYCDETAQNFTQSRAWVRTQTLHTTTDLWLQTKRPIRWPQLGVFYSLEGRLNCWNHPALFEGHVYCWRHVWSTSSLCLVIFLLFVGPCLCFKKTYLFIKNHYEQALQPYSTAARSASETVTEIYQKPLL